MLKILSVDLGDRVDPTAISILDVKEEKIARLKHLPNSTEAIVDGHEISVTAVLRFLERLPLGIGYPAIATRCKEILDYPEFQGEQIIFLMDATGVGVPVVQYIKREGLSPIGIMITSGYAETVSDIGYNVPKRELISCLQILLQSRRLKIPANIPFKDELIKEMQNFRVKITPKGNDTYGNWRTGEHDDLVLSLAMGAWYLERLRKHKVVIKPDIAKKKERSGRFSLDTPLDKRF